MKHFFHEWKICQNPCLGWLFESTQNPCLGSIFRGHTLAWYPPLNMSSPPPPPPPIFMLDGYVCRRSVLFGWTIFGAKVMLLKRKMFLMENKKFRSTRLPEWLIVNIIIDIDVIVILIIGIVAVIVVIIIILISLSSFSLSSCHCHLFHHHHHHCHLQSVQFIKCWQWRQCDLAVVVREGK